MKIEMATWDRVFRLVIGFLLVTWAVAGGPWWGYVGLVLIASGSWRLWPLSFRSLARRPKSRLPLSPPR